MTTMGPFRRLRFTFGYAQKRAASKGLPFDITIEHLRELFQATDGRCALTGIEFQWEGPQSPFSCSIDRIKPRLGYVAGNVRLVLMGINGLKGSGDDGDMWAIVDALVARRDQG